MRVSELGGARGAQCRVLVGLLEAPIDVSVQREEVMRPSQRLRAGLGRKHRLQHGSEPAHLVPIACIDRATEQVAGRGGEGLGVAELGGPGRHSPCPLGYDRTEPFDERHRSQERHLMLGGYRKPLEQAADELLALLPEHAREPHRAQAERERGRRLFITGVDCVLERGAHVRVIGKQRRRCLSG